jgi:hypothetical protein
MNDRRIPMKGRCDGHFPWSSFRLPPSLASLAFCLIVAALLIGIAAGNASPQNSKSLLRTIHGTVVDRNEAAVKSCVVYLKNLRTSDVSTRISDDNGQFRFSGLDPNADYQINAQYGGACSDPRTVSSFDSRTDVDLTLKLNRDKCK